MVQESFGSTRTARQMPADRISNTMFCHQMGEGVPLLWIHGLGESSLCFQEIAKGLKNYSHHFVDLLGYGRTAWGEPLPLEQVANLLSEQIDWRDAPVLLGHSMGGVLGILLLERFPDLARAFVNIDGNISIGDCSYSQPISRQSAEAFTQRGHQELLDDLYRRGQTDLAHRGYHQSMSLAQPSMLHLHSQDLVRYSLREDLAERMAALPVPCLYLAGSPGGACARSLDLLRKAGQKVSVVEPSGHWPFIDQPDAFVRSIESFLESL